uniref:hypothetical protein n=1 Tax=Aeromonas finlandensis TaxID=1543375 RepID=UPI0019D33E6B
MKYFDPDNVGFFDDNYDTIKSSYVPECEWGITYVELIDGNSSGLEIYSDQNRNPRLRKHQQNPEQSCEIARAYRDTAISSTMWIAERHR